jgi:transcriptional regulator with XRE-family HTH domain
LRIAEKIKEIREATKLNQKQVAFDLGISQQRYSRIEQGQ